MILIEESLGIIFRQDELVLANKEREINTLLMSTEELWNNKCIVVNNIS